MMSREGAGPEWALSEGFFFISDCFQVFLTDFADEVAASVSRLQVLVDPHFFAPTPVKRCLENWGAYLIKMKIIVSQTLRFYTFTQVHLYFISIFHVSE